MIQWFLEVKSLIRDLDKKSEDALELFEEGGQEAATATNEYMQRDYERLWDVWRRKFPDEKLGSLGRHIHFGSGVDYHDICEHDLPDLERRAEAHLLNSTRDESSQELGFERLLHPVVSEHSYQLYRNGHLREAVLNSITAVFDFIRARTSSPEDGDRLIGQVMSPQNPKLVLSDLGSESGQNDQKGFMQIFKGSYQGIRNPKAHSLTHDLTPEKAAQYLVFASLLARRVEEATVVE
ncbi:TIGR02391 family protein [Billgrantia desiderata SP1]|uniref:TIGR02391 family protein n=1 Tax=Billgrantia desiderata TaxID=52021 RepID=UPI000A380316|nr:TIGR02391 family protein [Halomonas desiderata]OUE46562.1 TIGR02391 family protein [Halomonas desiderata SP1]